MTLFEEMRGEILPPRGRRRVVRLLDEPTKEELEKSKEREENKRQWARIKADPELRAKRRAELKAWRDANPERVKEYRIKNRNKHREAIRIYQRLWRRKNVPRREQPRGEQKHNAKLTAVAVVAMRARYAAGGVSMTALGTAFGVSYACARKVLKRMTWTHLP